MARLPGPLAFDLSGLVYVPGPANQFTQLTSDTLGNAATDSDGFNALFAPPATALAGDIGGLAVMDQHIGLADFQDGAFDSTQIGPVVTDTGTVLQSGDAALNNFDQSAGITNPTPTKPAPDPPNKPEPPPPPTDGGGGGGAEPPIYNPPDGAPGPGN